MRKGLICLIPLLFMGCAGMTLHPTPPPGCEGSLILKYVPYPKVTDVAFKLVLFEVVKANPSIKQDVLKALDKFDSMLGNPMLTYLGFAQTIAADIASINQLAGVELIIISEVLRQFDQAISIDQCDRTLLRKHIAEQKAYLAMAMKPPISMRYSPGAPRYRMPGGYDFSDSIPGAPGI